MHGAGHRSQLVERAAQLQGEDLRRVVEEGGVVGAAQGVEGGVDVVAAAAQARGQRRLAPRP